MNFSGFSRSLPFVLLCLLLTGCAIQSVTEPHTFDPALEPTPVPTAVAIARPTYVVERGTVTRELTLTGRVVPAAETAVLFPIDGLVTAVHVNTRDTVQAGDILAELDTSTYVVERQLALSALEVAQARLTAVENQLANDQRRAEIALEQVQIRLDFARDQAGDTPTSEQLMAIRLLELDVELAQIALDELTAGVDLALLAEVEQAQLRLDELDALIASGQLVAPVDGTVLRVPVAVDSLVTNGETAVILADLTQLEIEAFVREIDLQEMVEGMAAELTAASQPGDVFPAIVQSLPPPYGTGENLEESTARFAFADSGTAAQFESSDRVVIDLVLAEHEETLWLPPAAVRDFQGRHFVVIQEGDTQRRVDVGLGIESDSRVEIVEGVAEGDMVVGP
jgi:multidrug efflux pump subunit AcrA (membrane-fusion protein)